jgi:hypothetical protein
MTRGLLLRGEGENGVIIIIKIFSLYSSPLRRG